ncbi:TPA: conjugal transfer protein TraG N-terminal domain-containing protein [Klebsiella aerogenes]|nr:conjugal transfer protein TraG N-terminal domain-containing protein [Klebsiella aerogenes]
MAATAKAGAVERRVRRSGTALAGEPAQYAGVAGRAGVQRVWRECGDNLNASQALSRLGSIAGMSVSSLALFPAFDSVRQALPMVQAFLGMALVICIPVILLFL